jgi:hypothetical protein
MQCSKITLHSISPSARSRNSRGIVRVKRFRSPKIDDQLKFSRCLNRKIAWLRALEYAIDVRGRLPELIILIKAIRKKPSVFDKEPVRIDCWDTVFGGQLHDLLAASQEMKLAMVLALHTGQRGIFAVWRGPPTMVLRSVCGRGRRDVLAARLQ